MPRYQQLIFRFMRWFLNLIYQPLAWTYDGVAVLASAGKWRMWVLSVMPSLSGPRILEVGHGPGHLQAALSAQARQRPGWQVVGLDRSPQMGRQAHRRLQRKGLSSRLVRGETQHLPFADHSFDQVVSTFPSEYIAYELTLAEVRRVLTPGGEFVVLPGAWITGRGVFERLSGWLLRVTGQAPQWQDRFLDPVRRAGFDACAERIQLPGSEVVIVHASMRGDGGK
jgi:ubiquinone/menaquinone biosynthesis C-methylase UbiE